MANPNFNDENHDDEFYLAASIGDADTIRTIFSSGDFSGINAKVRNGNTPLIISCAWGLDADNVGVFRYSEVIELLVKNGADINAVNNMGRSALWMAASWGHWDVVNYLLENGADTSDPSIMSVACFTRPRCGLKTTSQKCYYNHETPAQHHLHKMAKVFLEDLKESGKFREILTHFDDDYDRVMSYVAKSPSENIPDNVMNLIVYYNHFATVVVLVESMEPTDAPLMESALFLNSVKKLREHREYFEESQQK